MSTPDQWPNNEAGWLEGLDDRTQQERRDVLDAVPDVPPTEHPDLTRLREKVARAVEHGYTEGDVNHNVQFLIGTLRLMLNDGKTPDEKWMRNAVTKLEAACDAEDAWLNTPDVPPDPPAADRSAIIAVFGNLARELGYANASWGELADALLSSGVLVDAADVRARYAEELAASWDRSDAETWTTPGDWLRDRAVSEHEGTS